MRKEKIIVSCDTTIALNKNEIEQLKLHVIPLNAIADGIEYHDTVDIDAEGLAKKMYAKAKISTSTPTIGEIETFFDNLFNQTNADLIIHFTISSKLSSMYSLFTTVCNEKYPGKVIVVDSYSICYWMLQEVLYTRYLIENTDLSIQEILHKVEEELKGTGDLVFIPDSLEFLKRGGRVTPAVAAIAGFVGVVPILTFNDGEVGKKGVTRTAQKACLNAINEWKEKYENLENEYDFLLLITDSSALEKADKVENYLKTLGFNNNIIRSKISLNVVAHAGPGTVGFGIAKKVKM